MVVRCVYSVGLFVVVSVVQCFCSVGVFAVGAFCVVSNGSGFRFVLCEWWWRLELALKAHLYFYSAVCLCVL